MNFLWIFYGFSMDYKILTGMNIIELSSCHHFRPTRGQGTAGARNDQLRSCDFRANSLASQMRWWSVDNDKKFGFLGVYGDDEMLGL